MYDLQAELTNALCNFIMPQKVIYQIPSENHYIITEVTVPSNKINIM